MIDASERKLIADLRGGSREAYERLMDFCEAKVFNLVRRMVGDQDAEDVAQDALIEICKSVGGFRGASSLSTWVYRVAVNVCLEHRRRRRPVFTPIEEDCLERQADPSGEPAAVVLRNSVKGEVDSAVRRLSEAHRDVVVLHELQGLTYQECAEVLGCPVGTVKSRLSNAFVRLRELLGDYASEGEAAI